MMNTCCSSQMLTVYVEPEAYYIIGIYQTSLFIATYYICPLAGRLIRPFSITDVNVTSPILGLGTQS